MRLLHEPATRDAIRARVQGLTPDAPRQWGSMTADQMLWHVNEAMEAALGQRAPPRSSPRMPQALLRFVVLRLPWPRGAPTNPGLKPAARHDFDFERARCIALIDEISGRDINAAWPEDADFGRMTGRDWSRLVAKHLDHHLRQFGR